MLSCYEEDAIELFLQTWAGFFGHENILSRYQAVFGEGSVAIGSQIEGDPVFIGGFGNVYRRDGDRLQILMNVDSPVPFPAAEEWEEVQDAEAASQEG